MCRPDLTVLPITDAFHQLSTWLAPQMPTKLLHPHEKLSDAGLVAAALLQRLHKQPYFRSWWRFLKLNFFPHFRGEVQARVRLDRLTPVIERLNVEVQELDFAVIDSAPLPVCTFKRAPRCTFPDARHGFSTTGPVYGFKLHAWRRGVPSRWTTLSGKIAKYEIHPANRHDFTVACVMNEDWTAYGGPTLVGDKGYQSGTIITPPKSNAVRPDPRWKEEFASARKIIESTFSSLVGAGMRWGQVKTLRSLQLKVALCVFAHNLSRRDWAS